jgi:hypothetical protein
MERLSTVQQSKSLMNNDLFIAATRRSYGQEIMFCGGGRRGFKYFLWYKSYSYCRQLLQLQQKDPEAHS